MSKRLQQADATEASVILGIKAQNDHLLENTQTQWKAFNSLPPVWRPLYTSEHKFLFSIVAAKFWRWNQRRRQRVFPDADGRRVEIVCAIANGIWVMYLKAERLNGKQHPPLCEFHFHEFNKQRLLPPLG